ncbi:RHS Repeat protein [Polystyrenella longa]|uniref:RHS Repeat protein n=1 Tax=Polystyrenella longa TaxID=2528007 RepID=A0A518CIA9_9PLAN|nr:RHS repeat domain-containing protein [Polystyrenella longa]QDU78955.1 RHS Repeat protein [Polystyrenella longa]
MKHIPHYSSFGRHLLDNLECQTGFLPVVFNALMRFRGSIIDPLDRETDFTFNEQNQQLTRTLPVTGNEQYWYDEEDRNYRSEDFEGNVVDSIFTDEGLLDELQYFNSSADPDVDTPDETVRYTYDDQYRKTSMTDDRGTTYYTYDDDGRITQISSPEGSLNYEYDDLTGPKTRVTTGDPSDVENDFRNDKLDFTV